MDIFVGSLPFKLKESELTEIFERYGKVSSVTLVKDKRIGQNKGYGFVVMPDELQAHDAIANLNGIELMGRIIKVSQSEGNKDTPVKEKKPAGKSKAEEKAHALLKRKLYVKKKKINVIDKHSDDLNKDKKKKRGGVKLAKNFKVGKRKKR